jgi:hypothetical protein
MTWASFHGFFSGHGSILAVPRLFQFVSRLPRQVKHEIDIYAFESPPDGPFNTMNITLHIQMFVDMSDDLLNAPADHISGNITEHFLQVLKIFQNQV